MTVRKRALLAFALLIAALALVAAGCGGGDEEGGGDVEALPSSSCTAIEYEGEGDPDYLLASDFPLQGSSRTQTEQIVAAIRYELGQREWQAGDYKIGFQSCDDATAQAAKWDSGKCSQNGNAYAANDCGDRRDRDVQLWMRADHHPAAERGARRRHRDDVPRKYVSLPDGEPAGRL